MRLLHTPAMRHLGLAAAPSAAKVAPAEALPARARLLIGGAAFCTILVASFTDLSLVHEDWPAILLIAALGMAAERLDINVYGDGRVSVSVLFMVTAAVLFGPSAVLFVCPAIALAGHLRRGRPLYKLIFNASTFVLAALASAYVYRLAIDVSPYGGRPIEAAVITIAALANFAVSSMLVAAIIAFTGAVSPRSVWTEKFAWLFPHFVLIGFLAFVLTVAYSEFGGFGVIVFTLPAAMTRFTMKQYVDRTERTVRELRERNAEVQTLSEDLEEAYNETLAAFVSALDMRDVETLGHSARVAELSLELALALSVKPGSREWLDLKHGALLHDVGKIGVPDAILRKPGPLTAEEWVAVRAHPMHGYRMLSGVQFLANAAVLVRSHHERFDGDGYPDGLRGEEIPLAARIFTVADSYDAITSDRSYQSARSDSEACAEIAKHAGTQFDPRVVDALLRLKQRRLRAA